MCSSICGVDLWNGLHEGLKQTNSYLSLRREESVRKQKKNLSHPKIKSNLSNTQGLQLLPACSAAGQNKLKKKDSFISRQQQEFYWIFSNSCSHVLLCIKGCHWLCNVMKMRLIKLQTWWIKCITIFKKIPVLRTLNDL